MANEADKDNWWDSTYGDSDFGRRYAEARHQDESLGPTADFLVSAMNLKPGDRVLDQCCGSGPVSLALARKGIGVIGIDQAAHCIEQAKEAARQDRLGNTFFQAADAFAFKTEEPCDAAINWSSSCGYMRDDAKNIEMFNRAYDSLKPGGRFAVQYMHISNGDKDFSFHEPPLEIDGQSVTRENFITYDAASGMMVSQWVYTYPDGHKEELPPSEMRLYKPEDIQRLLEKAGFEDVKLQGGFHGEPLTGGGPCPTVIALARKPS